MTRVYGGTVSVDIDIDDVLDSLDDDDLQDAFERRGIAAGRFDWDEFRVKWLTVSRRELAEWMRAEYERCTQRLLP